MNKRFFSLIFTLLCFVLFGGIVASAADSEPTDLSYIIADGATYYESSFGFGSGRYGIVNADNPYTTEPCYAGIDGYSYLNEEGCSIVHDYDPSTNDMSIPPAPEGSVKLLKHFKTTYYPDNGWVDAIYVTPKASPLPEPEKQSSEELASMIENYDGMTVVIVDRSSSMDSFAENATAEFRKLKMQTDTTKVYIFGRYFKEVTPAEIIDTNHEVRKDEEIFDYLADVINDAAKYKPKHIIIITDLGVYDGTMIEQKNLESIDILLPSYSSTSDNPHIQHIQKAFPTATVKIREFEN